MAEVPEDFEGAVAHFTAKARQYLLRTLFAHQVVADVLEHTSDAELAERYGAVPADALGGDLTGDDRRDRLLARTHLGVQLRHAELFLHRLAAAKWEFHRDEVLRRWARPVRVPAAGLGAALPPYSLAEYNAPRAGWPELTEHLRHILGIARPFATWAGLDRRVDAGGTSVHLGSQILVAFHVRHQFDHRDGRADRAFRDAVVPHWANTSWQSVSDTVALDRQDARGRPMKVPIRHVDVLATTDVLLEAVHAIGAAMAGTGAGQQAR